MKQAGRKTNYAVILLIAIFFIFFQTGGGAVYRTAVSVRAETEASSVIKDLTTDKSFNFSDYPEELYNFSIEVIQIAESENGELFLYAYQPSGQYKDLTATTVRISTAINDNAMWVDYKLTKLNSSGVFFKYKVNDIAVKADVVRYYDISAIHRKYDSAIDEGTDNNNNVNEVVYEVGQLWTAVTVNGEVSYNMVISETITITEKYVDFIRYPNGWLTFNKATDSHYIAFSTDRQIDKLVEADVYFVSQMYRYKYKPFSDEIQEIYAWDPEEQTETLNYELNKGGNTASGLFSKKYEWQCIQSVAEFKTAAQSDKITLSEETETNLKNKQWILRFYESEYNHYSETGDYFATRVNDVTILRLKFETAGKTYNLGVVDNKQEGDDTPGNRPEDTGHKGFWEYIWNCIIKLFTGQATTIETVVAVVALVVAIAVFGCAVGFLKWLYKKLFK